MGIGFGELVAAMRAEQRIDGSAGVLGAAPAAAAVQRDGHEPPFLYAAYKVEPYDKAHPSRTGGLSFREFERLSLAARGTMIREQKANDPDLATQLDAALADAGLAPRNFVEVDVEAIEAALSWVARDIARAAHTGQADAPDMVRLRRGLQLIGCRITSSSKRALRLMNLDLPLSLSLIGCVFDQPILASNTRLISLDLSGSAFPGLEAGGLRAVGGVHLRRATVITPVSFAGAEVEGAFDGSDLLAVPIGVPHPEISLDAAHGMLNLSRARIENELVLDRARIWGGVSLRGAVAMRSVFLNGTILVSPLGILEKWAFDHLRSSNATAAASPPAKGSASSPVHHDEPTTDQVAESLAERLLHSAEWPKFQDVPGAVAVTPPTVAQRQACIALETVSTIRDWRSTPLADLLTQSMRARSHALRADRLTIHGSLFAENLHASGRVRLKYAVIQGGVRIAGAVLRSADDCRATMDRLMIDPSARSLLSAIVAFRRATGKAFMDRGLIRQDYALDLRNAHIQGDVSTVSGEDSERGMSEAFGAHPPPATDDPPGPRGPADPDQADDRKWEPSCRLHGVLAMEGTTVGGSVILGELQSSWLPALSPRLADGFADRPGLDRVTMARVAAATTASDAVWPAYAALVETGPWSAEEEGQPQETRSSWDEDKRWKQQREALIEDGLGEYAVDLKQARIGENVDLRGSRDIWGINLENAQVGGDVHFATRAVSADVWTPDGASLVRSERRARGLRGRLNLRSTEVAGDAYLVFDPEQGPEIRADLAQISGRLEIHPSEAAGRRDAPNLARARDRDLGVHFWLRPPPRHAPWRRTGWRIILSSARAALFAHAPSAWPHPNLLQLEGFRYERTSWFGPLVPLPVRNQLGLSPGPSSDRDLALRAETAPSVVLAAAFAAAILALAVERNHFGAASWDHATRILLFLLTAAWVAPIVLSWILPPRNGPPRALALRYLARQRTDENHYQHHRSRYTALDTYQTAADALREAGRYITANRVEEERLRLRTRMLSFRLHGHAKVALKIVEWTSGYGFRTSRMIALVIASVVLVTVPAAYAGRVGLLEPVGATGPGSGGHGPTAAHCAPRANLSRDVSVCPGVGYAIDLLTPFIDTGAAKAWSPYPDRVAVDPMLGFDGFTLPRGFVPHLLELAQIWGAFLFLIVGAAFAARVESAFTRVRE